MADDNDHLTRESVEPMTFDRKDREVISRDLQRYRDEEGIGVPRLCDSIYRVTGGIATISTLQRFLKDPHAHNVNDPTVGIYYRFLKHKRPSTTTKLSNLDAIYGLGDLLSVFFGTAPHTAYERAHYQQEHLPHLEGHFTSGPQTYRQSPDVPDSPTDGHQCTVLDFSCLPNMPFLRATHVFHVLDAVGANSTRSLSDYALRYTELAEGVVLPSTTTDEAIVRRGPTSRSDTELIPTVPASRYAYLLARNRLTLTPIFCYLDSFTNILGRSPKKRFKLCETKVASFGAPPRREDLIFTSTSKENLNIFLPFLDME